MAQRTANGRVAVCGMIAGYNESAPGPTDIATVVQKRLKLQGCIVSDHMSHRAK